MESIHRGCQRMISFSMIRNMGYSHSNVICHLSLYIHGPKQESSILKLQVSLFLEKKSQMFKLSQYLTYRVFSVNFCGCHVYSKGVNV